MLIKCDGCGSEYSTEHTEGWCPKCEPLPVKAIKATCIDRIVKARSRGVIETNEAIGLMFEAGCSVLDIAVSLGIQPIDVMSRRS